MKNFLAKILKLVYDFSGFYAGRPEVVRREPPILPLGR